MSQFTKCTLVERGNTGLSLLSVTIIQTSFFRANLFALAIVTLESLLHSKYYLYNMLFSSFYNKFYKFQ